jgi:metal-sulfur cluster biosynthetic enzyme
MGTLEQGDPSVCERIEDAVFDRVGRVLDPCGRANGTGLTLGDLGMVDDVQLIADGHVLVSLLLDDPVCLYMVDIHAEVKAAALAVEGVVRVDIRHSTDRLWDPDRVSADAKLRMARWREQRLARAPAGSRLRLALLPFDAYRNDRGDD